MLGVLVLLRRLGLGIGLVGRRGSVGHFRSCSRVLRRRRRGWSLLLILCRRRTRRRLSVELFSVGIGVLNLDVDGFGLR